MRGRRPLAVRMRSTVDWMKCSGVQSAFAPQMSSTKLRSSSMPLPRVRDLGMKLHGPDASRLVGNSRQSIRCLGRQHESVRQRLRLIAVAHPYIERARQTTKQRCLCD